MPHQWIDRLATLQHLLSLCPTDHVRRCELASLLEELGQHEEAFFNWKAVVDADPNHLKAREGMSRCRRRSGRSLHSGL